MYSLILIAIVVVSVLVALQNWRLGMLLCIIVGVIQDPIRKVTPDTPIYLTLAFVPIYMAMFVNLWTTYPVLPNFFHHYPRASTIATFLLLALAISSVQTLSYRVDAWQAVLLGLSFYIGWIPALFLGFFFLRRDYRELDGPLTLFGIVTALMLIGTLLEYSGVRFGGQLLGTVALKSQWMKTVNNNQQVPMMSGFYRAPEVMAWHAATLVIVSAYLFVRRPTWAALWIPQAVWGLTCVLLGGRRKMVVMALIFVGVFALLSEGRRRIGTVFYLLLAGVLVFFAASYFVQDGYLANAESGVADASERAGDHTIMGPLYLLPKVGLFGFGVGTRTQGTQHLQLDFDVPGIEGGFEKVLVELGIVGTIVMLAFVIFLVRIIVLSFRRAWASRMDSTPIAALAAFLIANALAYLVAFQVYGDPYIGFLLGLSGGLLLSASRLVALQRLQPLPAATSTTPVPAFTHPRLTSSHG